jgi:succinate dehydrogenase/fumarate reductase cytochrome b subunit
MSPKEKRIRAMSYYSQRALTSTVVGILLTAAYTWYALKEGLLWSAELSPVATAMLIFIGSSVVALILVLIAFHIVMAIRVTIRDGDPDGRSVDRVISSSMVEDEMEQLITWKAGQAASVGAGVGFIAFLVLLACGVVPALALHILMWAFAGGSLAEGCLTVWFNERGVSRG